MSTSFVLFDLRSGNVMTDFACESDAWAALREIAEEDGLAAIADFSLMRMRNGHPTLIAMEDAIVDRVAREMKPDTIASEARR